MSIPLLRASDIIAGLANTSQRLKKQGNRYLNEN